jgi:hypothetical protein
MRIKLLLLAVALCSVIMSAQFSSVKSLNVAENLATQDSAGGMNLRDFKVHLDSRSLWSTGTASQAEMAAAAKSAGYDVVFFADDAFFYSPTAFLPNGGFEEVNASGAPTDWALGTLAAQGYNTLAIANLFHRPPPPPNMTSWENRTYQMQLQLVRSGNSSLHLAIQNNSNNTQAGGYAYAMTAFHRPSLNQTSTLRPLLATGLNFSAYVYLEKLGAVGLPTRVAIIEGLAFGDNGWFYVRFTLNSPKHPYGLKITLVYEDHPIDSEFLRIRRSLNQTDQKVIFVAVPPLNQWIHVSANVTALAVRLWNETITDWRLQSVELGTRSRNNALTSAYVDDASLNAPNPIDYFKSVVEPNVTSNNFAVYPAYGITLPNEPSLYVYGTDYIPQNLPDSLMDPTVWQGIGNAVATHNGMVFLGPVSTASLARFISQNGGLGVNVMDGTSFHGLVAAGEVLDQGKPIFLSATAPALSPTDYGSSDTWATHVLAENNSEAAILQSIAQGRSYIAVSNFGGTFSTEGYGFPLGTSPIYIPSGANASLTASFNGLPPGRVMLFDGPTIVSRVDHNGAGAIYVTTPLTKPISHLFVAVTTGNNSISLVSNPTTFVQTSLLPGGALFMDNNQWIVQSSQWATTFTEQQSLNLAVSGPTGSDATLYLYSPDYRPDAQSQDRVARFITVDNTNVDPTSSYDVAKTVFVLHLHSNGNPIAIVFNFDVPFNYFLYSVLRSTLFLSLAVLVPIVAASAYLVARRLRRRSTHRKRSAA